jgi:hypothetical protein
MKLPFHTPSTPLARKVTRSVRSHGRGFEADRRSDLKTRLPNSRQSGHARSTLPMPTISRFYGIQISLRTGEANHPRAHFHAKYAEHKVSIAVDTLEVLSGYLPPRAMEMTLLWASLHRSELKKAWNALRAGGKPTKIEPLP